MPAIPYLTFMFWVILFGRFEHSMLEPTKYHKRALIWLFCNLAPRVGLEPKSGLERPST